MRFLLYSPDSYGLGHISRSLSVAGSLLADSPGASVRVLTGAPRAHYFRYPEGCDYVKLPLVTKDDSGSYVGGDVDLTLSETLDIRSRLILSEAAAFRPDILLVDHAPRGLCGEILPTLRHFGQTGNVTRVLGLRDVIDEPEAVKAAWRKEGVLDVMRHGYDQILVYGNRDFFDPVIAYDIPADIARKMTFVGYIPRNGHKQSSMTVRARFAPRTGRYVLVTLGGGGDGDVMLRSFLRGYENLQDPDFEVVAVTGPLMSPRKRERFTQWAGRIEGVSLEEYSSELPDLIHSASFVVSMGGYNTICELATAGARSLIVPRTFPRKEQLLRARMLADGGHTRILEPEQATPDRLMQGVIDGLAAEMPRRGWGLEFSALRKTPRTLRGFVMPQTDLPPARYGEVRP